MKASMLKDRVHIQLRNASHGALGETVTWTPVESKYARVILLDARARAAYQQLQSEVTHKVVFRGKVSLTLGNNRLLWGDVTLEPVEPTQLVEDTTIVVCKQV